MEKEHEPYFISGDLGDSRDYRDTQGLYHLRTMIGIPKPQNLKP